MGRGEDAAGASGNDLGFRGLWAVLEMIIWSIGIKYKESKVEKRERWQCRWGLRAESGVFVQVRLWLQ